MAFKRSIGLRGFFNVIIGSQTRSGLNQTVWRSLLGIFATVVIVGCNSTRSWEGPQTRVDGTGREVCALHGVPLEWKTVYQRKNPRHIQLSDEYWEAMLRYPNPHYGNLWDAASQPTKGFTEVRTDRHCPVCTREAADRLK